MVLLYTLSILYNRFMDILLDLITNKILVSAAAGWFFAQAGKMLIDMVKGDFSVSRLTGGGGFPSAHSSTVCSLAASTGLVCGFGGFEFVMALFFAIIVMYDARGVRYETGQQARILNKLRRRDSERGEEALFNEPLEEKMGHTVPELVAGAVLGIIVAIIVCGVLPAR